MNIPWANTSTQQYPVIREYYSLLGGWHRFALGGPIIAALRNDAESDRIEEQSERSRSQN